MLLPAGVLADEGDINLVCGIRSTSSLLFPPKRGRGGTVDMVENVVESSRAVHTTNLEVDTGTVLYDESTKVAKWNIGKLTPDKLPRLQGGMILQQIAPNTKKHASKTSQHRQQRDHRLAAHPDALEGSYGALSRLSVSSPGCSTRTQAMQVRTVSEERKVPDQDHLDGEVETEGKRED